MTEPNAEVSVEEWAILVSTTDKWPEHTANRLREAGYLNWTHDRITAWRRGNPIQGAICRYCGNPIKADQRASVAVGKSPTGWTHDSVEWLGNRCPNGIRSAEPSNKTGANQ